MTSPVADTFASAMNFDSSAQLQRCFSANELQVRRCFLGWFSLTLINNLAGDLDTHGIPRRSILNQLTRAQLLILRQALHGADVRYVAELDPDAETGATPYIRPDRPKRETWGQRISREHDARRAVLNALSFQAHEEQPDGARNACAIIAEFLDTIGHPDVANATRAAADLPEIHRETGESVTRVTNSENPNPKECNDLEQSTQNSSKCSE